MCFLDGVEFMMEVKIIVLLIDVMGGDKGFVVIVVGFV